MMKPILPLAIVASFGLCACGNKADITQEQAAVAFAALVENKVRFDDRDDHETSAGCAEGGEVTGLSRLRELEHAQRGQIFTMHLQGCRNRGIVMDGVILHERTGRTTSGKSAGTQHFRGDITLGGELDGLCALDFTEVDVNAPDDTTVLQNSSFCGYKVSALVDLLDERHLLPAAARPGSQPASQNDAAARPVPAPGFTPQPAPEGEPLPQAPVQEDDSQVVEAADVEWVPDEPGAEAEAVSL